MPKWNDYLYHKVRDYAKSDDKHDHAVARGYFPDLSVRQQQEIRKELPDFQWPHSNPVEVPCPECSNELPIGTIEVKDLIRCPECTYSFIKTGEFSVRYAS